MPTRIRLRCLTACLVGISCLVAAAAARAENWPQFRGEGGSATAADARLPLRWSETENMVWKTPLPGRGSSSPVVWGDRVFLTAFTGYGTGADDLDDASRLRLHVICLDRGDGRVIWDQSMPASEHTQQATPRIQDHGYATGTPATDGQAVYAFFGVSGVVAYDFSGQRLWHREVGTGTAGFGSASSPVVFENLVLVNASIENQTLLALDKRTGETVWSVPEMIRTWTTPCVAQAADGTWELVLNQEQTVFGLNPRTGETLWKCAGIPDYVVPVPVAHEGIVYCLGGRQNRSLAIRLGGRGDVTETHKLWDTNIGANVTSPVLFEGHLYWASDKGIANCLKADTGEEVYRQRLDTRERIYASIVRAGDRLLLTTRENGIIVLAAKPQYEELAVNKIETDQGFVNASPVVVGHRLLLRTDSHLYCIGQPPAASQ